MSIPEILTLPAFSKPPVPVTTPEKPKLLGYSLLAAIIFREIQQTEREKWGELVKRSGTSFLVPLARTDGMRIESCGRMITREQGGTVIADKVARQ